MWKLQNISSLKLGLAFTTILDKMRRHNSTKCLWRCSQQSAKLCAIVSITACLNSSFDGQNRIVLLPTLSIITFFPFLSCLLSCPLNQNHRLMWQVQRKQKKLKAILIYGKQIEVLLKWTNTTRMTLNHY